MTINKDVKTLSIKIIHECLSSYVYIELFIARFVKKIKQFLSKLSWFCYEIINIDIFQISKSERTHFLNNLIRFMCIKDAHQIPINLISKSELKFDLLIKSLDYKSTNRKC